MKEKIGNVVLDYTYYPGKDLYSDGEVEEELLEISENYPEEQWNQVIAYRKSWPVLYHYSHIRQNSVEWLPIKKEDTVLEIGSGCGAITGSLAKKAGKVTCIELSKRRSRINANRNKKYDNIEILVGNFQDISWNLKEKFDYITLIGVFEYSAGYIGGEHPYVEMLKTVSKFLKPNGKLIIAIENRMGLKYWAGCREDHVGELFEGIEGYPNTQGVRTFSLKEWDMIFEQTGMYKYERYYPYPDYKFPMSIHSDVWLPKGGELRDINYNFDRNRLRLFDETRTTDQLIENDLYPWYANSYLFVASLKEAQEESEKCIFSKYSNDRSEKFSMRTDIILEDGKRKVIKQAESEKGKEHLDNIAIWCERLTELYQDTQIRVNQCRKLEDGIELEYLEGQTLEQVLDDLVQKKEYEEVWKTLKRYLDVLRETGKKEKFRYTEEFGDVFGKVELPRDVESCAFMNIDPVCSNILWSDTEWKMLDYEWTFAFPIPVNFQIYRVLKYYLYTSTARSGLQRLNFWKRAGISEKEIAVYDKMEENFQKYIVGTHTPLRDMYQDISPGVYLDVKNLNDYEEYLKKDKIRIYPDQGNDFTEKTAWSIDLTETVAIPKKTVRLRIDPCEERCIIGNIRISTEDGAEISFYTNGKNLGNELYFFETSDPYIIIENIPQNCSYLVQSMNIQKLGKMNEDYVKQIIQEKEAEAFMHASQITQLNAEKVTQEQKNRTLENELEQMRQQLEAAKETLKATKETLKATKETLKAREHLIDEMKNTKVWKMYSAIKRN